MTETFYDFGDDIISHQKHRELHRLVLCNRPLPQEASDWSTKDQICAVGNFVATWDKIEKDPYNN